MRPLATKTGPGLTDAQRFEALFPAIQTVLARHIAETETRFRDGIVTDLRVIKCGPQSKRVSITLQDNLQHRSATPVSMVWTGDSVAFLYRGRLSTLRQSQPHAGWELLDSLRDALAMAVDGFRDKPHFESPLSASETFAVSVGDA